MSKWFHVLFFKIALPGFGNLYAQPVNFSYQGQLLNTVSGFAGYADCAVDMNGDYLDDVVRIGNKGIYVDYQQANGSYQQRFFAMPVQSPPTWSICAGDLDNNGFNDLLFAHSSSVSFVVADPAGGFLMENVMPVDIFSQRSTLADIDNDGHLDAFVCHDLGQSVPFRNEGLGGMVPDTNLIHTSSLPGNYAAIWTDFDNDGDVDLYISKCLGGAPIGAVERTNLLYRNNGDGTFTEVAASVGLADNSQSWSTVFEDFDNDGDMDAFIVNHDNQNLFFRNDNGLFTDVTATTGIAPFDLGAFENTAGDFNNDGFMDIFSDLTQQLYLGHGNLTFTGQNTPVPPGAIGDFNNDGFLDILKSSQLWINEGNQNHWLKVHPLGLIGNRNGIGARVEIHGPWGVQVREVRSGQSFGPMSSLAVHFGLGQYQAVDSLLVKWPSGTVTKLANLSADSAYHVPEANCLLPFSFLGNEETELCPGDTLVIEAPSGFDQYHWSNGGTEQVGTFHGPGIYFVAMTDSAGCVSLSNFIKIKTAVDEPPSIVADPGNRSCEGDEITLTASHGNSPIWSDGQNGESITVSASGVYSVLVDAKCSDGQLASEGLEINFLPSPPPDAMGASIVQGDSVLLSAVGDSLHWYGQPVGGSPLHIGPDFQTPSLAGNTVYYVEDLHVYPGEEQHGGKLDNAGPGGLPSQTGYMLFEAWEPFTLVSVMVYLPLGGPEGVRFVQLFSPDTLLAFKQFQVVEGWNELELNFDVPVGKYSLHCPLGNLFRNTGPLDYPYPLGDMGQVTTSFFGDGFYYYFYDWKIKKREITCISVRIPIEVMVTDVGEKLMDNDFEIFPNPTDGQLFIRIKNKPANSCDVRLVNAIGQEFILSEQAWASDLAFDISDLQPGVYVLQLIEGGRYFSKKVVLVK